MYLCPKCRRPVQAEQQRCASCGLDRESGGGWIAVKVNSETPPTPEERTAGLARLITGVILTFAAVQGLFRQDNIVGPLLFLALGLPLFFMGWVERAHRHSLSVRGSTRSATEPMSTADGLRSGVGTTQNSTLAGVIRTDPAARRRSLRRLSIVLAIACALVVGLMAAGMWWMMNWGGGGGASGVPLGIGLIIACILGGCSITAWNDSNRK